MTDTAITQSPVVTGFIEQERFALDQREATAMMRSIWVPDHLKSKNNNDAETVATCVGIVQMARLWRMSSQAVAQATYPVKGKIGFEGKLYAALANAFGDLEGGLRIIFSGDGGKTAAVVFGSNKPLNAEHRQLLVEFAKTGSSDAATQLELTDVRCVRLSVEECDTGQAMWKKDPKQKLFYTGATKWCRRYLPHLVMGVVSVEDLELKEWNERQGKPSLSTFTAAITSGEHQPKTLDVTSSQAEGQGDQKGEVDTGDQSEPSGPAEPETQDQIDAGNAIRLLNTEIGRCKKKGELEALSDELDTSPDWTDIRRLNLLPAAKKSVADAIERMKAH